jgi:hypothetical protein
MVGRPKNPITKEVWRLASELHECPKDYEGPCWGPNPEDYVEALRRIIRKSGSDG